MKAVFEKTQIVLAALLLIVIGVFLMKSSSMSANWVGPYLSASHNLHLGGDFMVNLEECIQFNDLTPKQQLHYKFLKTDSLNHYNHNPIGYAYIIWLGTKAFFFTGDQMAIILFQIVVHILLCFLILNRLKENHTAFYFFLFGYMLNPLILKYVGFNFYYFWQAVPGMILLLMLLDRKKRMVYPICFALLFPFLLSTRMTLVLLVLVFLGLIIKYYKWYVPVLSLLVFLLIFSFVNKPTEKNLWHTVYVGIAAYQNPYVQELSDNEGYALFQKTTGEKLNASLGGNYYETNTIRKYQDIAKEEVLTIFEEAPLLFVKNALLNSLQLFSLGYINKGGDALNYASALFGLIVLIWLISLRKFFLILLIAAPSITFTVFYPPIPAYMYGSYIFLLAGFYFIVKDLTSRLNVRFAP